jgi:tRNA/tmRNA/rRNA uracil-C5-methylase (TrmA/RlmC/RlmD family)
MIVELQIDDVAYGGDGLGRHGNKVVFVPDTLPGETVRVEIKREYKTYARGRLIEVIRPSAHRAAPGCPLADAGCPGCCYQHAAYEEEIRLKQRQLEQFLRRQCGLEPGLCLPPLGAPSPLGYRNKLVLHPAVQDGHRVLGYVSEDNTSVLDVPRCPLAVDPINDRLAAVRVTDGSGRKLRSGTPVTFRFTDRDGALHWAGRAGPNEVWLQERTCIGPLSVPRKSFFQVNPAAADMVIRHVGDILERSNAAVVVDAYCGVGVFALLAAQRGRRTIVALDSDPEAVKAAEYNLRGAAGVRFHCAEAAEQLEAVLDPLPAAEVILIVDPPRAGLDRRALEAIAAAGPAEVVYVSCAADTLSRDLAGLLAVGYGVRSVRLVDMFPRTAGFETVTHLRLA